MSIGYGMAVDAEGNTVTTLEELNAAYASAGCEDMEYATINGIPCMSYSIKASDVGGVAFLFDDGTQLTFNFSPLPTKTSPWLPTLSSPLSCPLRYREAAAYLGIWSFGKRFRLGNFLSFRKKRKKQRKSRLGLPQTILVQAFRAIYGKLHCFCAACLAQSQRRLPLSLFMAHASYNLYSFRDSANGRFCLGRLRPRHARHPSAARCKFGGEVHARRKVGRARKNQPSRRETMASGYPRRAHHILKWARKLGRYPPASVQASSTRRERQNNHRRKVPLPYAARQLQSPPCSTGWSGDIEKRA